MSNIFDPIDSRNPPKALRYTPKPHLEQRLLELTEHLSSDGSGKVYFNEKGQAQFNADWFELDADGMPHLKPKRTINNQAGDDERADASVTSQQTTYTFKKGDKVRLARKWDNGGGRLTWIMDGELGLEGVVNKARDPLAAYDVPVIYVVFSNGRGWWLHTDALDLVPAWDPMTEPLRVGDVVEVVYPGDSYGKTGEVVRVDMNHINPFSVLYDGATRPQPWGYRSSLKLLSRAS